MQKSISRGGLKHEEKKCRTWNGTSPWLSVRRRLDSLSGTEGQWTCWNLEKVYGKYTDYDYNGILAVLQFKLKWVIKNFGHLECNRYDVGKMRVAVRLIDIIQKEGAGEDGLLPYVNLRNKPCQSRLFHLRQSCLWSTGVLPWQYWKMELIFKWKNRDLSITLLHFSAHHFLFVLLLNKIWQ